MIFERIKKIISSNTISKNNYNSYEHLFSEEDELKRIIDELNNKTENNEHKKNHSKSSNSSTQKQELTLQRAYEILNIKPNASQTDIKAAYTKMLKEYHPDKVANLGRELQELAHYKTLQITEAYKLINNSK